MPISGTKPAVSSAESATDGLCNDAQLADFPIDPAEGHVIPAEIIFELTRVNS